MREGKRYLSLFLAAAITVTGVNVGTAFQVNAADSNAALVSERDALSPGIGSPDDGKEALSSKIAAIKAENLNQNGYTAATWQVLVDALAEAERVNADANATKEQRQAALDALTAARNGLVVSGDNGQQVNKTLLKAEIAKAGQIKQEDCSAASWTALQTALNAAKAIDAKADATQAEVNTALTNLQNAIKGLVSPDQGQQVNKAALKTEIANAQALKQADYTPASWTALQTALNAAKAIDAKADATQAEVNTALTNLQNAIKGLVGAEQGQQANKTALKTEIAKAEALKQADYTPASWTVLNTALKEAKTVDAKAGATQAEVNTALTNLQNAIKGLVKAANKTNLKKSIDAANKLKKNDYTAASWKTFNTALTKAKNVYNNPNATQAQVNDAKSKLDAAKKALKKKVVKVSKVTISNGKALKIAAGKKVTLKTTVAPKNATNTKVKWSISKKDQKYASVSSKGVVTTKNAGAGKTVTVTATAADGSKKKASIKITIMKNAVTKITLRASKTVKVGKKVTVKATVKTNGKKANKTLAWKSSNTKWATVNNKGVVTAKKAGKGKTVTITATATDGSGKKGTIKIKIKK